MWLPKGNKSEEGTCDNDYNFSTKSKSCLQSIEHGVAQVIWFLFVFLLPWCLCQSLLNLQEHCSEEQVSPQCNAEQRSHWC